MKVIIRGKIIETSFILSIDKNISIDSFRDNMFFTDANINIKTIFGEQISIESEFNSYHHKTIELANKTVVKINQEFDKIIKFLDDHSDKPNLPYPIFE